MYKFTYDRKTKNQHKTIFTALISQVIPIWTLL